MNVMHFGLFGPSKNEIDGSFKGDFLNRTYVVINGAELIHVLENGVSKSVIEVEVVAECHDNGNYAMDMDSVK